MKDLLVTSGFPRSGNTFLNYVLRDLYYPTESVNNNFHTVVALSKFEKIIVPFRNPLDCISSWNYYPSNHTLEDDIKFYLRFYNAALKTKSVIFADFDKFTINIDYIKNLVLLNFGITHAQETNINLIKSVMEIDKKTKNLPNLDRTNAIDKIKNEIIFIDDFANCVNLYQLIKGANQ